MSAVSSHIKRRDAYKKAIDNESCRRRREDASVEIRKQKREENLAKRRFCPTVQEEGAGAAAPGVAGGGEQQQAAGSSGSARLEDLPRLMMEIRSGDARLELEATRGIRKILSVERQPPVLQVLQTGVLPQLVEFLKCVDRPELQFEAAWALTNVASTEHTKAVVDCGAVPWLAQLLLSPSADVREQCAWCLGNIAGDSPKLRDAVLEHEALVPLLKNILQPSSVSMLRNTVWALSNFCRGKPPPLLSLVTPALPMLAQILRGCTDSEVLQDACWALSYLSDGDNERIQAVVDSDVISDLVRLLGTSNTTVLTPALRTLGNLVSGNDLQTQSVLDAGALVYMPSLLRNAKKNIRKETCWLLSNVAAGNANQISTLTHTKGLLPLVIGQMAAGEFEVRKEAAWVVSNVATGGNRGHVQLLVDSGAIKPLCDLLTLDDVKLVEVALDALEAILKAAHERGDSYAALLDEADGHTRLEELQQHENQAIYEKAVGIIEKYLGVEDEEDENIRPNFLPDGSAQQAGTFAFGVPQGVSGNYNFQGFGSAAHPTS